MNIEQMKYIIEIAKEGSISKAAEKLHISASAISQSISQLEEELATPIFERSKKGMKPTKEGRLIISKSFDIVQKVLELHKELESQKKDITKVLKVACTPTMTYAVLDAFISLKSLLSDVKFLIEELDQDTILNKIKNEEIDLAFASFSKNKLDSAAYFYGVGYQLIFTGYLSVLVNRKSPLASLISITPKDIENEKVVVYNSNYVKSIHEKHLINKDIFVISNNIEILKNAIIHGPAITLAFNFFLKNKLNINNRDLAIVPFKNPEMIYEDFWCLYSLTKGMSNIAEVFKNKVIELLTE
jgi:LysR family transcriptional regulator, transcription activator of glutamate synthase operon